MVKVIFLSAILMATVTIGACGDQPSNVDHAHPDDHASIDVTNDDGTIVIQQSDRSISSRVSILIQLGAVAFAIALVVAIVKLLRVYHPKMSGQISFEFLPKEPDVDDRPNPPSPKA